MPWQEEFPQFERNYFALLDNLNLNMLSELELHHRARLLKLTISRGWRILQAYNRSNPEQQLELDEPQAQLQQSLQMDSQLELQLSKDDLHQMDWEIREVVLPAFRDLYHFLRQRYNNSEPASR